MNQSTTEPAVAVETLADVPEHVLRGLPEDVRLFPSAVDKTRLGVWATKSILKGKKFGPFVGDKKKRSQVKSNVYMWEVYYPNLGWMCVDATDPEKGNWLRYINWARSGKEQNLFPLEINRTIYYKSLKPIAPGEELLVWYNGEDDPEIAAAIEEERASARSRRHSPKAKKGKKKTQEGKNKGKKAVDTNQKKADLDSPSADMRDSKEGHKEEDETPSVSAVLSLEQTAVIQEMVNQEVLPKLMVPSPSSEPQMVTEDKQGEAINCASDDLDDDEEEEDEEEEDEEEEDEEEIEDTSMPKEHAEMPLICEEKLDSLEEQKSTSEESPESSPKKKLVVKVPKARGESNGDVQETFMFPCQHCERKFTTKQGLERHMHIHISTFNHAFRCRYCGKAFGTQINRRRHERRHEAGPKRKPFLTLTSSQHLDNVADNQVIVDDGLKDDLNVSSLVQDSVALDSEKVSQEMSNSAFAEENKEPKELHPCKYCKKVFGTHTNMRRHQRRVHERHLIPKGVRRKGFVTEEPPLQTEQAPPVQSVYIASTEIEEEGEVDDVYIMDISSNISENLNYYIDGKIQSNSSTSNCDVIQMESNSADLYGLNCIISPVMVEISPNLKVTQTHVNEPPKEPSSSGSNESKKRRTASPPLIPKIKTEVDPEPVTPTSSLNLPLSISTESLPFHKEKGVYLSSKLKQLLQTQDSKKMTPSEIPKLGPSVTSSPILPPVSSRFKRRTSSPPSSPQHSPVLRDFVKSGEGKTVWNDNIRSSKMPKLESHSNSPAWSLTGREEKETLSTLCFEDYKMSKDWTAAPTFGNVCNQQPLDLSSGMKQRSDVKNKNQVPWESVLDLSVHKKPCSDAEIREYKENSIQPTCSGVKKKKPTTCMLQKVLLNEYNGTDTAADSTLGVSRSASPSKALEPQADPDVDPGLSASSLDAQPLSSSVSPVPQVAAVPSMCQLPPLLTPTNPPSPPPCPPVLTVATSPPSLLPTMPLPIPDVSASATNTSSCPSPLSNTTTQSPLPVLSPTVSPSPSPVPSVEPLISAASPGPPTLSSSSSSSSSSSFSSSSSSSSPSPPPLSVVSSVVSSADNLENTLPIIKQEEGENEQQKAREDPHTSSESVVQETFNKSFVCNVCESPFLSIKDLTKHLSIHAEEWPFKCEFCVQLFRDKTDLSEHRFLLHGVGNIFVCSICKKEFAFLCNLQQHQRDLHPDKECTHHQFESGTLRPQNFTDPSKANVEHMQSLPKDSLEPSKEEEDEDLNDSSEELYTTIKIMASGVKSKDPDVRMGLNQHYPSFKPPPFQYHHRNPMGIGVTATNFTTHNIPQTFTTAIRCTKCGKSVDNMPELHKHILACASASDKKRYTPKKNPVPLKQTVQPKNGMVVIAGPGKNAFRRMGQPKRLNFNVEISKMSSNKLKISALKKKNQLVQKAILQKKKSAQQKAELKNNPSESDSHICPYCNREFTYIGSLNKHASYSCPKKPISPSSKKNSSKKSAGSPSPASSEKGNSLRRRTADAEIKMQGMQPHLGKTRARSSGPAQLQLPSASFKSKQNVKFVSSIRSKKPNSSSSLRNSSPVRVSRMAHGDGKKTKVVAKNNSSGISSKVSRKLHVRIQRNNKAVLPSKSAVASKKKADRFAVKSHERIGGPITRSLQQAANAEAAENKGDESTKQELKDFSYRLRMASRCPSSSSHNTSTRQCKKPNCAASHFFKE